MQQRKFRGSTQAGRPRKALRATSSFGAGIRRHPDELRQGLKNPARETPLETLAIAGFPF